MNVVVFHGSARRNGDTDTLAEHFLRGMNEHGSHDISHFYPIDMNIEHCRACNECSKGHGCVIQDGMQAVYPAFKDAELSLSRVKNLIHGKSQAMLQSNSRNHAAQAKDKGGSK